MTLSSKRKLLPFIYSADIAYLAEFGNKYARFYYDDELITSIETPYSVNDIFRIHYVQIGDVMRLVARGQRPRKLLRTTPENFEIKETTFIGGPFEIRNDLIDPDNASVTTLRCNVTAKNAVGILTASVDTFSPEHVGALFKLTHPKNNIEIAVSGNSISDELYVKGTFSFITRGTWTGVVVVERNENEGEWEAFRTYRSSAGAERNASFTHVEKGVNVKYRINAKNASSKFRGELTSQETIHSGIVKVTGYIDEKNVNVIVVERLEKTTPTRKWYEGSWSNVRGWPSAIAFFEDRCFYAGAAVVGEATSYTYPLLLNSPI